MEIVVTIESQIKEKLRAEVRTAFDKVKKGDKFRIGVSGGSMVKFLRAAVETTLEEELQRWQIFFCDERYVTRDDADSTFRSYKENYPMLDKIMVPIDYTLPLDECAKDYEELVLNAFKLERGQIPEFDLLLLGMGDDGHTCSLFPGHKLLEEKEKLIAPIDDSPKPPAKRITMTLPLINNAKRVIFVVTGSGKADIAKRVFIDKEPLPAGLVAPRSLKCIFDEEAGRHLGVEPERVSDRELRKLLDK